MSLYQFHFIGVSGDRPALDFSDCAGDGEAAREAISLLGQHGSALAVEVWDGDRLVIRIERSPDQVLPVGTPLLGARSLGNRPVRPSSRPPSRRPQG